MALERVTGKPVFRLIQAKIREHIIDQDLEPGDKLPPAAELADSLGVSSSSLREALRALQALGVVETRHGVGTFVRAYDLSPILENLSYSLVLDKDSMSELLQVREAMEIGLLSSAMKSVDSATMVELENAVRQMRDPEMSEVADLRFHQALYQCLENRLVHRLIHLFWVVHRDLSERGVIEPDPDSAEQNYAKHLAILKAIHVRDEARATRALKRHFRRTLPSAGSGNVSTSHSDPAATSRLEPKGL